MSLVAPRRWRGAKKVKLEIDQHRVLKLNGAFCARFQDDRPLQFVSLVHGPDPFFA